MRGAKKQSAGCAFTRPLCGTKAARNFNNEIHGFSSPQGDAARKVPPQNLPRFRPQRMVPGVRRQGAHLHETPGAHQCEACAFGPQVPQFHHGASSLDHSRHAPCRCEPEKQARRQSLRYPMHRSEGQGVRRNQQDKCPEKKGKEPRCPFCGKRGAGIVLQCFRCGFLFH